MPSYHIMVTYLEEASLRTGFTRVLVPFVPTNTGQQHRVTFLTPMNDGNGASALIDHADDVIIIMVADKGQMKDRRGHLLLETGIREWLTSSINSSTTNQRFGILDLETPFLCRLFQYPHLKKTK